MTGDLFASPSTFPMCTLAGECSTCKTRCLGNERKCTAGNLNGPRVALNKSNQLSVEIICHGPVGEYRRQHFRKVGGQRRETD